MGAASDGFRNGFGWRAKIAACRESRKLVLVIVAIALLLDNMLLTTVGELLYLPSTGMQMPWVWRTGLRRAMSNVTF